MIDQAIDVLNEALAVDPIAVNQLMSYRVPCTDELAAHPSIQVNNEGVSPLGLINGLFGVDDRGYGFITAEVDESTGYIVRFVRTPGHA